MCDCIDKNNEFLAMYGQELDLPDRDDNFPLHPDIPVRPKKGHNPSYLIDGVMAVCCPWCGEPYDDVEHYELTKQARKVEAVDDEMVFSALPATPEEIKHWNGALREHFKYMLDRAITIGNKYIMVIRDDNRNVQFYTVGIFIHSTGIM